MCTASIISAGAGFRVVVNRDEERDRPPAYPPRWHNLPGPGGRAIWPIDPLGGGTWVAATADGLVLCLLNGNPEPRPPAVAAERVLSRGVIIPLLIESVDAAAAVAGVERLELDRFPPLRLVATDGARLFSAAWDGQGVRVAEHDLRAACFVSSGLGDRCVAIRQPLFDAMVRTSPNPAAQDAFHRHRWPERPELSVLMSRAAARTVSITTVEVGSGGVTMAHEAVPEVSLVPREAAGPFRRGGEGASCRDLAGS